MRGLIAMVVTGLLALGASPAAFAGEAISVAGTWRCTVNSEGPRNLKKRYSYDMIVKASRDGSLSGRGTVIRPGNAVPIAKVRTTGKWAVSHAGNGTKPEVSFNMRSNNGARLTWKTQPIGRNTLYVSDPGGAGPNAVRTEIACGRVN